MALAAGVRLGPYEVLGPLGAGGMGEVYRARDTKLNRDVALKVLPELLAGDPDRLARFRREAQVLASLNHPNIAHLYGFDDASSTHALVMELVEGPTLADRIAQKPIPLADALLIAKQIVDALEAAHEQGIVHRDLKPANIKVRDDGTVKVLDFGLAKALGTTAGSDAVAAANLPTEMNSALTERGVILGTAAYMSPEQAVGKPIDKRSDLWAFGVVLFEMLSGRRVFAGPDLAHVLAAVLKSEPDWTVLPADTPTAVRRLLRRCLEKDRRRRIADAADARLELEDVSAPADRDGAFVPVPSAVAFVPAWRRALPWAAAAVGLGAALVLLTLWAPWRTAPVRESRSLLGSIGAEGWSLRSVGPAAILSPDGKTLAFVAGMGKGSRLFVRKLELLDAVPIALTDDADSPFFSPDGQWIAFFAGGKLKKVSVTGGAVIAICDAQADRGGTWLDDNTIIFSPNNTYKDNLLLRVSASGATAPTVFGVFSSPDGTTQRWPQALPRGKGVLYTENVAGRSTESANLVIAPLSGGAPKIVGAGYYGRYVPSGLVSSKPGERNDGHLIYVQHNTLFAVPFDLDRLLPTGPAVNALAGMGVTVSSASAQLAFSTEGTLVYGPSAPLRTNPIDWVARDGQTLALSAALVDWANPRFSRDGKKLALGISDGKHHDIWVYEWAPLPHMTQLTANAGENRSPVWIDDEHIVFSSDQDKSGVFNLYLANADASGEVKRLTNVPYSQHPASSYGRLLAYTRTGGGQENALMVLPIEGDAAKGWTAGTETVFFSSPGSLGHPEFSPDGHWIAYSSTESGEVGHGVGGGRYDIWVRPYPRSSGRLRVSQEGGKDPRWSVPAHELLFLNGDLSQVSFARYDTVGNVFHAYPAEEWSSTRLLTMGPGYDLNRDGRIAGVIAPDPSSLVRNQVVFFFNFFDHLRKIAPAKK